MEIQIVVVDDDVLIIELLKRMLKNDKCDVVGFTDQTDCLSHLSNAQPNYLFVDMRMPKMNGLAFIQKMKSQNLCDTTKIFLCSGATPDRTTLAELAVLDIQVVNKNDLCNKVWLRGTLGFDDVAAIDKPSISPS